MRFLEQQSLAWTVEKLILLLLTSKMTLQVLCNLVKLYKYVVVWMTLHKRCKYVVIPSVCKGWEVWNDLKNKEILHLNRLQHFIEKHTQKFSALTRSGNDESMARLQSKTSFSLGKLCTMDKGI